MNSAIYAGMVSHRRVRPAKHGFAYTLCMLYLDLDEVDSIFKRTPFWSMQRPALARLKREDFHGDPAQSLKDSALDSVENALGFRPPGPVCLLTQLRYFGCFINPVCFYYCFDHTGENLEALVAEVTNTPWGEKQVYVWPGEVVLNKDSRVVFEKEMHVSPFMQMEQAYTCTVNTPAEGLCVSINNIDGEGKIFNASLRLRRRPMSSLALNKLLVTYPLMTLRIAWSIYYQAFKLWNKGVPFVAHPKQKKTSKKVIQS